MSARAAISVVVPVGRRVELEAQVGIGGEPARDGLKARGVAEPERHNERDRVRLAAQHVGQRAPGLAQREVGRGGLERPAPVGWKGGEPDLRPTEEIKLAQMAREAVERPFAGQRERRPGLLLGALEVGVVDDVLADPLLAGALQVHDRRGTLELGRDGPAAALEAVALDREREIGEGVVERHEAGQPSVHDDVAP